MPAGAGSRAVVPFPRSRPRRVATLSVHTSPLDQPGTGDAGGMNVYIVEVSRRLAEIGVEVEIFTRATSSELPPVVEMAPGRAGPARHRRPVRGPGQGGPARPAVRVHLRGAAGRGPARAGLVRPGPLALLAVRPGRLARQRPLGGAAGAHRAHPGQGQERRARRRRPRPSRWPGCIGEEQVVAEADRLVANTADEARQLVALYGADPDQVVDGAAGRRPGAVPPGRRVGGADPAGGAARTPWCCCSSAASSRSRRPTCCCRRSPRAAGAAPELRRPAPGRGRRRPERQRARPARAAAEARRRARHRRPGPLRAAAAAGAARRLLPRRRRRPSSPATTSPSAWSRWRPRRAAPRSSPPPSAACGPRSADGVSGVLVDGARPGRLRRRASPAPAGRAGAPGRAGPRCPRARGALLLAAHRRRPARGLPRARWSRPAAAAVAAERAASGASTARGRHDRDRARRGRSAADAGPSGSWQCRAAPARAPYAGRRCRGTHKLGRPPCWLDRRRPRAARRGVRHAASRREPGAAVRLPAAAQRPDVRRGLRDRQGRRRLPGRPAAAGRGHRRTRSTGCSARC